MKKILKDMHFMLHTPVDECTIPIGHVKTVKLMFEVMDHHKGVGLAANQIGINKRIIVVRVGGFAQEFINPVITKSYGGKTRSTEGCLSVVGQYRMFRHKQIVVIGYDRYGIIVRRKLKGEAAIVVQHEIDHLDGITIRKKGKQIL